MRIQAAIVAIIATINLSPALGGDADIQISQIGANSQRLSLRNVDSSGTSKTNSFVQVETGLNYVDAEGKWAASEAIIENGQDGAYAWKGQHKASFAGNLNQQGAIQLRLPDGRLLVSHVLGLAYYDSATGESVLLADVRDCEGWIHPPNQVIYTSAFNGVDGDIRYVYSKFGFEQDIIIRKAPPSPSEFGFDPATTRLEVWTEFVDAPEPLLMEADSISSGPANDGSIEDTDLDFGSLRIGRGRAFALSQEEESLSLVAKSWVLIDNRRFLVEAVPVATLAAEMQALPTGQPGEAMIRQPRKSRMQAMLGVPRRPVKPENGAGEPMKTLAGEKWLALNSAPGLVLDYSALITTQTNFVFKSDTTYYLSGTTTLTGTNTTFEGGTVIKYASTNTPKLVVNTPVTWSADLYRPVVLTARDDTSVGETVGSAGLSGYYADTALELQAGTANTTYSIANLRIAHAKKGIVLNQKTGHVLSHVQMTNCQNGILPTSTSFTLLNALFANVLTNFNGSSATSRVEHLTVDTANWLNYNSTFATTNLTLVNTLLVALTNSGSYTGLSVATSSSPSTVFQSVGGGSRYLSATSVYRNASTHAINAALTNDFRYCTTYPPRLWTNTVTLNTTISPVIGRDTDTPDLGYHYPALDYLSGTLSVTNSTLTVTNGVAIGFTASSWIWTQSTGALVSRGAPDRLNVFTRYSTVQEGPATGASTPSSSDIAVSGYSATGVTNAPSVDLQFTSSHLPTPGGYHLYSDGSWIYSSLTVRDSVFYDGLVWIVSDTSTMTLANHAQWRTTMWIEGALSMKAYNLLNRNGYFDVWATATNNAWIVRDSAFDNCNVGSYGYTITNSQNAYIGSVSVLTPTSSTNIVLTTFAYAAGTLGPWYHGQTNLVDKGSRAANTAGLYHYTTQSNQTKETTSTVDIGFHYVATNSSGVPLDNDSDGVGDYLEDLNGNGTLDSGETNWQSASDLGLRVFILQPRSGSQLP